MLFFGASSSSKHLLVLILVLAQLVLVPLFAAGMPPAGGERYNSAASVGEIEHIDEQPAMMRSKRGTMKKVVVGAVAGAAAGYAASKIAKSYQKHKDRKRMEKAMRRGY